MLKSKAKGKAKPQQIELSETTFDAIEQIARETGDDVEEIIEKSIAINAYLRRAKKDGKKIIIRDEDNQNEKHITGFK